MSTQDQTGGPTPQLFFQTANAYQRTQALKAAVDLDRFTAIGEGKDTVPVLAQRCGAAERGVRMLADYLTIQAPLERDLARGRAQSETVRRFELERGSLRPVRIHHKITAGHGDDELSRNGVIVPN